MAAMNRRDEKPSWLHRLILCLRKAGNTASIGGRFRVPQSILRRIFRHAHGIIRVDDFDGDLSIDLCLSEHMQRRMFWMGYYSSGIVALLHRTVQEGMVVIDVGANIGEISMVAANRVGGAGKVVAFEPVASVADQLEKNVKQNHLNQVVVVRSGLSNEIRSNVPVYTSCGQDDSLDENHGLSSLYGATTNQAPLQRIAVTTLDAWCKDHPPARIDLIKIDVEGSELPCLQGAEQTLRRFRPTLIVEVQDQSSTAAGYHAADILDFLANLGYRFQTIGPSGRLAPVQADTLGAYQNVLCTHEDAHTRVQQ